MRLDEHARDAQADGGARHDRSEFALAAGTGALAARLLHRMRRIHDHRPAGPRHDRQAAHVGDKGVVAKADPTFRQQDAPVAGAGDLVGDVGHVPGGQELALLDVHRRPRLAGGQQKIGLPRQERRDLDHIHHRRRLARLARVMDIGQDRHPHRPHRLQHLQPGLQPQAALARQRGAVGLVIAGLEHILRPGGGTGLRHSPRDHLRVVQAFQLAGARDDQKRPVVADAQVADPDLDHAETCSRRIAAVIEIMR